MLLSLHISFSLERATVVWTILESTQVPFMTDPRYLKLFSSSSLLPYTLNSLCKPSGLFAIIVVLPGSNCIFYLVHAVSILEILLSVSCSSSALSSAKRILMKIRPLTPNMLKRVGESMHPCRTAEIVLNPGSSAVIEQFKVSNDQEVVHSEPEPCP